MSNLNDSVIVPSTRECRDISGGRKTLQSVPRCLDEPRWLQETGNSKEEEEEEEEACVIKRYSARLDRVSFERRSSVPRKIILLFLEDRVHDSGSRVRHRSTRGYARRSCWFSFALFGTGTNTIRERGEIARRGKDGGFWLEEGTISLHRAPSPSPPWNSLFRILNINPGKLLARQQSFALVTGLLFVALAISNSYGSYLYIYIYPGRVCTRVHARPTPPLSNEK